MCSQETAPVQILSKLNHVHIFIFHIFKIHFNIIFPSMQSLLSAIFPSGAPTKLLYVFLLSYACYMPNLSHSPSFDHHNEKLLRHTNHEVLTQFAPASHYCLHLTYNTIQGDQKVSVHLMITAQKNKQKCFKQFQSLTMIM
jgi:hypothetical protein